MIRPLLSGLLCLAFLVALLFAFPRMLPAQIQDAPISGSQASTEKSSQPVDQDGKKSEAISKSAGQVESAASAKQEDFNYFPLITLLVGIAVVLGLIIVLKVNAFIALITAAIVVSLMAPGEIVDKIARVAKEFGISVGGIGIVIAMAAVIGKCMLDSGAADRIVRMFLRLLGEKRAPVALMGSGFVLAIPVFFDTVFYLLVPLARSLHRKTRKNYLTYIMAIVAGGAITHTLVPPTPGPLLMAANLGVDLGVMILMGCMIAIPSAIVGLFFAGLCDRLMKAPMRDLSGRPEPKPLADDELPGLWISLAPVLLPVLMISASTISTTIADSQHAASFVAADFKDWDGFQQTLKAENAADNDTVGKRLLSRPSMQEVRGDILLETPLTEEAKAAVVTSLNNLLKKKDFYNEDAFLGTKIKSVAKSALGSNLVRQKLVDTERMNRVLLESAYPTLIAQHEWNLPSRQVSNYLDLFGNANLALLISAVIAMLTLVKQRGLSLRELGLVVEESLMSGGVIILITAGGGAFGAMLLAANVGPAIEEIFGGSGTKGLGSAYAYLSLGFGIACLLKIAQGSSTVAMIICSAMMAAIVNGANIGCHYVYLATAIGAGSLVGSWMNDSGFWIFAKMGGLTEVETLKSWTIMLIVLGIVSFLITLLFVTMLPLV